MPEENLAATKRPLVQFALSRHEGLMSTAYLYLSHEAWVEAWVTGGDVPVNPASFYLSIDRRGTQTPDENMIRNIGSSDSAPFEGDKPFIDIRGVYNSRISNMTVEMDGRRYRVHGPIQWTSEDGYILSMSTGRVPRWRHEGKRACVQIRNLDRFKSALDERFGAPSEAGVVKYTDGFNRNHFLKSSLDSWQAEYRFFWPGEGKLQPKTIRLPPGLATRVEI